MSEKPVSKSKKSSSGSITNYFKRNPPNTSAEKIDLDENVTASSLSVKTSENPNILASSVMITRPQIKCFSCQKIGDLPYVYSGDKKYEFCSVQCMALTDTPWFEQLKKLKETNLEQEKEIKDLKCDLLEANQNVSNLVDENVEQNHNQVLEDQQNPEARKIENTGKPFHPSASFSFPKNEKNRACQLLWFVSYSWLTYDVEKDRLFCYYCKKGHDEKYLKNQKQQDSFITTGFNNWKKGIEKFEKHKSSHCHKESIEKFQASSSHGDVAELLSTKHATEKYENRKILVKIIQTLQVLLHQGLAIRGKDDENSNLIQLLRYRALEDSKINLWLERKYNKFVSHAMQNELIEALASKIFDNIAEKIRDSTFYALFCDETPDVSNVEQAVITIRWIKDLEVHEDFIRLSNLDNTTANTIVKELLDCLSNRLKMTLDRLRAQCYDGAASMSGKTLKFKINLLDFFYLSYFKCFYKFPS